MSLRDLGIIRFMRNCFFVHKNLHDYILKVLKNIIALPNITYVLAKFLLSPNYEGNAYLLFAYPP